MTQTVAAIGALIVGLLVYLVDRGSRAFFVPDWLRFSGGVSPIFGSMGTWLPTFAHTFGFASLTAVTLWPWPSLTGPICVGWFAIEVLFELGQIHAVARQISVVVAGAPVMRVISNYFTAGTFDPLDVISIAFGSGAAYLLLRLLRNQEIRNA